jgi:hypothetical protein
MRAAFFKMPTECKTPSSLNDTVESLKLPWRHTMKQLLVTGFIALAVLLPGCASLNDPDGGFRVEHPDPVTEMTKGTCCRQ